MRLCHQSPALVWETTRQGRHAALLGAVSAEPPDGLVEKIVRVRCDAEPERLGPILEAHRRVGRELGDAPPRRVGERARQGLRHRLLGENVDELRVSDMLAAANRLARLHPGGYVLAFDAVDAADVATLRALRRAVAHPGVCELPIVVSSRETEPKGALATLLEVLRHAGGAVVDASAVAAHPVEPPIAKANEPTAPAPRPTPSATEALVERALAGADEAEAAADWVRGVEVVEHALEALSRGDATATTRRARLDVLVRLGQLELFGAGPDYAFGLDAAARTFQTAYGLLTADDPAEVRVTVATALATACYEIGDAPALERALAVLTDATEWLIDHDHSPDAARMLNDQAAVLIRMGDPVRATHLLERSRALHEERADRDEVAFAELAETDHLLARIPLHAPARPGREHEAIEVALRHARRSEGAYRRLGKDRDVARVHETIARLELRAGHVAIALELLASAARVESEMGDAVGLARTSSALADAMLVADRDEEASELLLESVRLNVAKGSPVGLAFNRRTLERMLARRRDRRQPTLDLDEAAARIEAAESRLGRVVLPNDLV